MRARLAGLEGRAGLAGSKGAPPRGLEVRAGLAGIMDIQPVVITPVPVTGGAGAGCCRGSRSLRGRIRPVASGGPAGATVVELRGHNTRR